MPFLARLGDVTVQEVLVRYMATSAYWAAQCSNMMFFYSIAAIAAAVASPRDIRLFRPLFGAASDAYTMRNAWG